MSSFKSNAHRWVDAHQLFYALLWLVVAGCSAPLPGQPPVDLFSDMDRQPSYKPQTASSFFEDGRASRVPVQGTVARGHLKEDDAFYRGMEDNAFIAVNPLLTTEALLGDGRRRYDAYCAPCHDSEGSGRGPVALRAEWIATALDDERVRGMSDGELFDVISRGRRSMRGYRNLVTERDRWAIVAYVRVLQGTVSVTNEADQ